MEDYVLEASISSSSYLILSKAFNFECTPNLKKNIYDGAQV